MEIKSCIRSSSMLLVAIEFKGKDRASTLFHSQRTCFFPHRYRRRRRRRGRRLEGALRSLGRKSHWMEKEGARWDDRAAGMNFLKDRRFHERWIERMRMRETLDRGNLRSRYLTSSSLSLPHLLLWLSPSSFRHTSAPSLFQPLRPRFFIWLFARAFRHLTPVVSRHRRGCPTEPLKTWCGDIGGMRERRLIHLHLWSVPPHPLFLLNLFFFGTKYREDFTM